MDSGCTVKSQRTKSLKRTEIRWFPQMIFQLVKIAAPWVGRYPCGHQKSMGIRPLMYFLLLISNDFLSLVSYLCPHSEKSIYGIVETCGKGYFGLCAGVHFTVSFGNPLFPSLWSTWTLYVYARCGWFSRSRARLFDMPFSTRLVHIWYSGFSRTFIAYLSGNCRKAFFLHSYQLLYTDQCPIKGPSLVFFIKLPPVLYFILPHGGQEALFVRNWFRPLCLLTLYGASCTMTLLT